MNMIRPLYPLNYQFTGNTGAENMFNNIMGMPLPKTIAWENLQNKHTGFLGTKNNITSKEGEEDMTEI